MSENEQDSYDEEAHDPRSGRGPLAHRRSEKSWGRDRSASRERSLSPRSDRRSVASSQPARPTKVTLVKSRKNEGISANLAFSHENFREVNLRSLDIFALLSFVTFVVVSLCLKAHPVTAGLRARRFPPLSCCSR